MVTKLVKNKLAVVNVISSLQKNPALVLDDRYPLSPDDFPERFHKIIFAAIDHLAHNGVKHIDEIVVDDYLAQYPSQHKVFTENGGIEYLQKASEISEESNYEYYFTLLKKYSLLSKLQEQGFDISKYYCPDDLHIDTVQKAQDELDKSSLDQIIDYYDVKVAQLRSEYCSDNDVIECHISKGMRELKEELAQSPAWGLPMNSSKMTTICHGRRLKKLYLKSIPSGGGKAVTNSTRIPTMNRGWTTVGDIKVGDELIGSNGKATKVLAVYPQPSKKQVYIVHFSDGRQVECCEDHLWSVYSRKSDKMRTLSTRELFADVASHAGGYKDTTGNNCGWRLRIPFVKPVEYEPRSYFIPPYVMGLLLGDGCFRISQKNRVLYYSSEDSWLPSQIAKIMGWTMYKRNSLNYSYYFKTDPSVVYSNVHIDELLSEYPDLINTHSHTKFIPKDYLIGSIQQRMELLRGLLDTDGTISCPQKGRVSFSTTSTQMAKGIIELCQSLGMRATLGTDGRTKYKSGVCYTVHISCSRSQKPDLFNLPRKKQVAIEYSQNKSRELVFDNHGITKIEATDRYEDMTCFTVDSDDALFCVGDYVLTHNTRVSMSDACRLAIPQYYDPDKKRWVKTKCSEKVLFITTELEMQEIQTLLWAYVACVPEDHITDNKYEPGEEARVKKAIDIIEESNFRAVYISNFDMADIESIIKRHKIQYGTEYVFFDYLYSSSKSFTEMSSKAKGFKLREDQNLMVFAEKLKSLCNKYDVHIDTSTQTNDDWKNAKNPDQSVIRGAKSIADKVDIGYVALEPTDRDKEAIRKIMPQLGLAFNEEPNLVYHVYKVRRGKINHVKVFIHFNYGTLRTTDMFVTDRDYKLLDIKGTNIEILLEQTDLTEEAEKQKPATWGSFTW